MRNIFQTQLRLVLLIATFGLTVSCLISNCPKGGKRAEGGVALPYRYATSDDYYISHCTPCGPRGEGVCMGRNVCCGKQIGCLRASKHTKMCRGSRKFSSCVFAVRKRSMCGEEGYCKADNLCCSKDLCMLDETCKPMRPLPYGHFMYPAPAQLEVEAPPDITWKSKDEFDLAAEYGP